jgi:hypothetical protein
MLKHLENRPFLFLGLFLILAFGIHTSVLGNLNISLGENLTWQAYLFNALAAAVILGMMLRLSAKGNSNLGFIFMGGSMLKFLVFFLLFYPSYKSDGLITSVEFSSFFIPYVICLSFKSVLLIRVLNRQ